MAKKISQLPVTSPVQNTDYTIVYDLESGATKRATKDDFKGDAGTDGTDGTNSLAWSEGVITPDIASGVVGDYYLKTDTNDVYRRNTDSWDISTNIEGAQGIRGIQGESGPQGIQGPGSNIRTFSWVIANPASGVIYGPRLKEAHTITRIDSSVDIGSVTFNINERTNLTIAGSNILSASQVALASGVSSSSFNDSAIATDNWLALNISSIGSVPTQLVVTISATT
jgi:hypothetical protein